VLDLEVLGYLTWEVAVGESLGKVAKVAAVGRIVGWTAEE